IDASDMPTYANGQRYIYNGGPERQTYSDPDASWGHRSAVSTRKGGGFYGHRIHAAVAMDMGYDNNRGYAECAERDCAAIIPLRRGQPERKLRIPRSTDEWRNLYRRRSSVEREFGRLKHSCGLAFLRV